MTLRRRRMIDLEPVVRRGGEMSYISGMLHSRLAAGLALIVCAAGMSGARAQAPRDSQGSPSVTFQVEVDYVDVDVVVTDEQGELRPRADARRLQGVRGRQARQARHVFHRRDTGAALRRDALRRSSGRRGCAVQSFGARRPLLCDRARRHRHRPRFDRNTSSGPRASSSKSTSPPTTRLPSSTRAPSASARRSSPAIARFCSRPSTSFRG